MAQYNQVTPEIVERLQAIAPGRVYTGADVNEDYSRDEMPIYGTRMPDVAIDAMSTEEISAIMKICNENHIPVTCRGAGTGLAGACTPIAGGVVICTMKMKKILSYDTDNFTVTVQPGVLLNDLAEDALKQGLLYPPDPGEKFATLGGNVSTNAGGMRAVKYGATRDYVRSMTVVLPSGEVVKFGSSVSKTSSGYSLLNLMIGSEGTLGIITELTLKLIPAPKVTVSLIVPYESLPDAIATVPQFKKAHMNPQALEFFEREILISSEEYLGKAVFPRNVGGTDVGAYLLVTFDGETQEEIDAIVEKAAELVLDAGALDVLVADTPAKMKDAWAARSSFLEGIEEQTKLLDECEIPFEMLALSAHRTPAEVEEFAKNARSRGIKVIIAAAGMAAHLPGVIASMTTLPVIGVPIKSGMEGLDALLAIVQMPPGIPVATVGINAALNAAILATQILALGDETVASKVEKYKTGLTKKIVDANQELASIKYKFKTN